MKPKTGDIYSYYIEEEKKYTAMQIAKSFEEDKFIVVALDYFEDSPIEKNQIGDIKILYKNHHNWKNQIDLFFAQGDTPADYTYVGNIAALTEIAVPNYNIETNWYPLLHIALQREWGAFSPDFKDRYANASSNKIPFGDGECKEDASKATVEEMAGVHSGKELDKLPRLTDIYIAKESDWLISYLEENSNINRLVWNKHNSQILDFRNTALTFCGIDTTELKKLYVNKRLKELSLVGEISPDFTISLYNNEIDTLHLSANLPPKQELNVKKLWIQEVVNIDITEVLNIFPDIEELRIFGKSGIIHTLSKIVYFKKLKTFSLTDIYGFDGNEFPAPNELPTLTSLWLTSIPSKAGNRIQEQYSKVEGFKLNIERLRNEKWIEENINNPFHNWYTKNHISANHAKKASDQYAKFSSETKKIHIIGKSKAKQTFEKMVHNFTTSFNKMNVDNWIESAEREQIASALSLLLTEAKESFPDEVDEESLFTIFENARDF